TDLVLRAAVLATDVGTAGILFLVKDLIWSAELPTPPAFHRGVAAQFPPGHPETPFLSGGCVVAARGRDGMNAADPNEGSLPRPGGAERMPEAGRRVRSVA